MNDQIEQWRVNAYEANVYHLSQQEGSAIEPLCVHKSFVGKADFFDRLGEATAQDKVGRNVDTPNLDIDHSRRMCTTATRHWGTLVDRRDKMENIHNPEHEYAKAAAMGIGRRMDQVLIEAALGTARTGEEGAGTQTLGNAQKVAAVDAGALSLPNVALVRKMKRLMDSGKVKGKRWLIYTAEFLEAMLGETEVTSSDFNTVKALVAGEVDTFLGFKWINCEELADYDISDFDADNFLFNTSTGLYDAGGTDMVGTEKLVIGLAEGGLIRGESQGSLFTRITEREDKCYSGQVYTSVDKGGVRMEEAKVVQGIYLAS